MATASLKVTIVVAVIVLLSLTAAGIWIPTSMLATSTLVEARKDQMKASSKSTAHKVLTYFQTASNLWNTVSTAWNASVHSSGTGSVREYYFENFGKAVWSLLQRQPQLSSSYVGHTVNGSSPCQQESIIMSSVYVALIGGKHTVYPPDNCTNRCIPYKGSVKFIAGAKNPTR